MRPGDALDDRQAEAGARVVGADALEPRWNGSASVATSCGVSFPPVFSTVSTTPSGRTPVALSIPGFTAAQEKCGVIFKGKLGLRGR